MIIYLLASIRYQRLHAFIRGTKNDGLSSDIIKRHRRTLMAHARDFLINNRKGMNAAKSVRKFHSILNNQRDDSKITIIILYSYGVKYEMPMLYVNGRLVGGIWDRHLQTAI